MQSIAEDVGNTRHIVTDSQPLNRNRYIRYIVRQDLIDHLVVLYLHLQFANKTNLKIRKIYKIIHVWPI